jgi:hypothetical protein
MIEYTGWTATQRRAERDHRAQEVPKQRWGMSYHMGRSIKCFGYGMPESHAADVGGCRNDGSTCLCECHDPDDGTRP